MTALRSDFSSGKPLPASVASESAASTSARRTVAGASGLAGTVSAVTARCYPRSGARRARRRKGGRRRRRRAIAAPGQPLVVGGPGVREPDVGEPDREGGVVAERVLEGGLHARVEAPPAQCGVEGAAVAAQRGEAAAARPADIGAPDAGLGHPDRLVRRA